MRETDVYSAADQAVQLLNRDSLREFGKLKTKKHDELNIIQEVTKLYRTQAEKAKRRYREIGIEAYLLGLYLAGVEIRDAKVQSRADEIITREWVEEQVNAWKDWEPEGFSGTVTRADAGKVIDEDWVEEQMEETNFITLYRFNTETERKAQRLAEALGATENWDAEIDRALRYWSQQVAQYAISITDAAVIEAYEDAAVKLVRWLAVGDEKTCGRCRELDGKVYEIKRIPVKPHYGCRCRFVPVFRQKDFNRGDSD